MATGLAGNVDHARSELGAVLRSAPDLPAALGAAVARFSEGRSPYHLLLVATLFVVLLALGWIAERLVGRLLAGIRGRLDQSAGDGPGVDAASFAIRVVLDLLLLAVFAATVFAGFLVLYQGHEATRELIVSALVAVIQVRLAILVRAFPARAAQPRAAAPAVRRRRGSSSLSGPGHPRLALRVRRCPQLLPAALRRAA